MDDETIVTPEADVPPATPADVTPPEPPAEVPPAPEADVPPATPADEPGAEGDAPAEIPASSEVPVDGSRTGFVDKGQAGGQCICPDGRKGTIHTFDAGLVCIPNHDQSE